MIPANDRYRLVRRRGVAHLVELGERAVLEAMIDVERGRSVDDVLADFERIDAAAVSTASGRQFPPLPLYIVGGAR